jgi:hypothetical protein
VHALHTHYAVLLMIVGAFLFVAPAQVSEAFDAPCVVSTGTPSAVAAQSAGLITFVLGVYSLAAAVGRWPLVYFRLTYFPRFVSAALFAALVATGRLPTPFLLCAAVEATVASATVWLLSVAKRQEEEDGAERDDRDGGEWRGDGNKCNDQLLLFFDWIAAAQVAHAVMSGAFQMSMLGQPRQTLSLAFGVDAVSNDDGAVAAWGHAMGVLEFFMTWTYALSGVVGELGLFVRLSVVTRCLALVILVAGWAAGVSTDLQVSYSNHCMFLFLNFPHHG